MKIIHITPTYWPALSGAQLHIQAISEGLASRGHDVTVLTANTNSSWDDGQGTYGGLPPYQVINGVKVVRFRPDGGLPGMILDGWCRMRGGYRSLSLLLGMDGVELLSQRPLLVQLIPYLLRSKADVVAVINWYHSVAFYAYLAKKIAGFRFVGIPLFHTERAWAKRMIYKKMLVACDAVIANTSHEAQFVQQSGALRVKVAGVGVHPSSFKNLSGDRIRARYGLARLPVVGFVGRQTASKGAARLLQAMLTVWKWNPEVRLVLAGPPSPSANNEVETLIQGLTFAERQRIVRIGEFHENEKASIFDAFDVFVMPSTEESFGIAYLEAWMCRKPVVGARIGSTNCVIEEGVDGLLVDPDDPDDIARALIELLSDDKKRERMGAMGHDKTLAQFTWGKVTDKVETLYRELVSDSMWLPVKTAATGTE